MRRPSFSRRPFVSSEGTARHPTLPSTVRAVVQYGELEGAVLSRIGLQR